MKRIADVCDHSAVTAGETLLDQGFHIDTPSGQEILGAWEDVGRNRSEFDPPVNPVWGTTGLDGKRGGNRGQPDESWLAL